MPFALALAYLVIEAVAFYLVAIWIGVGWALLALFALMILGALFGMSQLRLVATRAARQQASPARTAGDIGLIMAGTLLAATPGFFTGIIGLLFIFPPTRAILAGFAAGQLTKSLEKFGTRVYTRSPMAKNHTEYGHFVIDEDPQQ